MRNVTLAEDAYDCAAGAHALAIVTEWNEFRNMDLRRLKKLMKKPVLCDLRNLYDPNEVASAGWTHVGVGRGRPNRVARRKSGRAS
jgi:UDPglucose 6-dehydrogenase